MAELNQDSGKSDKGGKVEPRKLVARSI